LQIPELDFKDRDTVKTENTPTPKAIKNQLEKILESAEFKGSEKQRNFLSFVVNETLDNRASQIKGFTIAVAVYGRTEKFDPQVDPIVRVEAGRLRRALAHYYLTAGEKDPIIIEIPKGSYVPAFRMLGPPAGGDQRTIKREESALTAEPTIAVMPLINMDGDKGQEYFTDGLTEELTIELARYQDFQVIASQSTMRFKGQALDPREVGENLGVRFLLMGSVRKGLEDVKVTIQLLDATTAEQIWGSNYKLQQAAADLIAMQEDVSQKVIGIVADHYGLIKRRLSRESRKKAPADSKVYDAILRFYHYESKLTPAAFNKALSALEKAVEIDPEYGLAWAMLGHLHADNYALGFCEIEASLEKALAYAQKGVALASRNQFARDALTLAHFHRGDKVLFLKYVEETLALNPNAPYIVGVAGWHMVLCGEWERGLVLLKKGMKLNPYHPTWFHLALYMDYYRQGEFENAFAEALKFNYPDLYLDPMMRAAALGQLKRAREAREAVGQLLGLAPDFATRGRRMIRRYVKVEALVDSIIEGLKKAGLGDID